MARFLNFIHDGEVDVVNFENVNCVITNKENLAININFKDGGKIEVRCSNGVDYDAIIKQIIDNL